MPNPSSNPIDSSTSDGDSHSNGSQSTITSSSENQRQAFENAAKAIVGESSTCSSDSTSFRSEIGNLESWASDKAFLIPEENFDDFDLVSDSTSEHQVFLRQADSRVVKRTLAGVYGQIPVPNSGKLDRRNARPSEYLKRMALQLAVFGGDISLEGVTVSDKPSMVLFEPAGQPSFVISQRWYERAATATDEIIHDFLVREGFRAVPQSYFGWYRPEDRVVIVDAKPDNFILTDAGLVPIDLQMSQFSECEVEEAGLRGDVDAPVIFIPRS